MEDIQDSIADQLAQQEEVANFFTDAVGNDKDELEDELNEMMAMDELEGAEVGLGGIASTGNAVKAPTEEAKLPDATAEEEDELQAMMAI